MSNFNHIAKTRKVFPGKKGQANTNPGTFTRIADHVERHTSDNGTYFLVIAFVIFLLDLSTTFFGFFPTGPRYAGFEWVWGQDFINILTNIVTSSIFATFVLFFIIVKIARRDFHTIKSEIIGFVAFSIIMTFFILNNNWIGVPKAIIHFIFILLFGFTFIRSNEDSGAFYLLTTILLLVDFFGYTLLSELVILRYIPFLLIFVIFYVYGKTQNSWSIIFVILLLVVLFIFAYKDVQAQGGDFSFIAKTDAPTLEETREDFIKGLQNFYRSWELSLQRQIRYAITGKVEENQYEQLGVYLEDARSADSRYYEGEDIVIWGTVKARTLDDPVNVKMGCFIKDGTQKIQTKKIDPEKAFPVFTLEEKDFACTFENKEFASKFKSGSKTITTFAEFNFETLAFLKTYFMDRERLRAMTRENLDPLDEFGIKEKKPLAIYTNGPAEIGMETTSPLIGVSNSYIAFPRLSMSIKNRQGWEGRITRFNEVVLLFPKGIELTSPGTDCSRKFESYDAAICKDKSCKQVNDECMQVCDNYDDDNEKRSCSSFCEERLESCTLDCDTLFEGEGSYLGFSLAEEELKKINNKISKDDVSTDFEFISCRLNPKPNEVLENTPITTKSFRTKIRYNYVVEKPVTVRIDRDPSLRETTKTGDVAIKGSNEVEQLIIDTANNNGIDPIVALAIASVESRFRHCCRDSGQNRDRTCTPTTEIYCPADRIIESFTGTSIGIMQINREEWTVRRPEKLEELKKQYGCGEQTINDLNCNIKLGVGILKENIKSCGDLWKAVGMYNTGNCNSGQTYISKVQTAYNDLKEKRSIPQQGFNIVEPPTNLNIADISDANTPRIFITWIKSQNQDVQGYTIKRTDISSGVTDLITINNVDRYTDNNAEYGKSYSYTLISKSSSYSSGDSETKTVTLSDKEDYEDIEQTI